MEKLKLQKNTPITIEGYFLKNWASPNRAEESKDKPLYWYPIIVVKTFEKNTIEQKMLSRELLIGSFIVLTIIALVIVYIVRNRWAKRDVFLARAIERNRAEKKRKQKTDSENPEPKDEK